MGRYRYSYTSVVRYSKPVSHHSFLVRAVPMCSAHQMIIERQLYLLNGATVSESYDSFGNGLQYGYMCDKHDIFVVASSGVVECGRYEIFELEPSPLFSVETLLTHCDCAILEAVNGIELSGSFLQRSLVIADWVWRFLNYTPGVTSTKTTAAECYVLGAGVCQDYSHLMIAMCRAVNIMARYVVGFVVGTGETHAWVEISSEGVWYGIDPTHNCLVESGYIKIAHGRDAHDCSVVRGIYRGDAIELTEVQVVVEEIF